MSIPDSHLHSALRDDFRNYFKEGDKSKIPDFLLSQIDSSPINPRNVSCDSERIYGILLGGVYSNSTVLHWTEKNYKLTLGVIQDHVSAWLKALNLPNDLDEICYQATEDDLKIYSEKVKWEDLRISMQRSRSGLFKWRTSKILPAGVIQVHHSSHYMLITIKGGETFLLDYEQVMMIADTLTSRALIMIYHAMLPSHVPGRLPRQLIKDIFKKFDNFFLICGNEAFASIKMWEPLIVGILISQYDRIPDSDSFLKSIEKEIENEELMVAKEMLLFLRKEKLLEDQLSELHGFYRLWGHPTVDEAEGCKKVKKIAQSRPYPKGRTLVEMDGLFIRQFCISFLKKHGRWPCVSPRRLAPESALYKAITHHTTSLDLYSPSYPLKHWATLELEHELEFDFMDDFTEIVDDKSISVKRSEIRTLYSKYSLGYDPGEKSTSRRLLLEILSIREIDVRSIVDKLCRREWDINDLIVIVHSKEREMKMSPRLFAMMTLSMRIFFVITEKNIKDNVFGYFPQQTMTLNEATLNHRLFNLTSKDETGEQGYFVAFAHIDFKSWNIHWSWNSLHLLCRRLNQLFGIPGLYDTGHIFFRKSLIALASHHNAPESLKKDQTSLHPIECDTLWYNHNGGFEGIMQKLWTLQTIVLLLLVEFYTGIKSIITGQGDNQIVKLLIPLEKKGLSKEQYILQCQDAILSSIRNFMVCLKEKAADIGLEVKIEESFVTTDILVYGKKIIYKGAFLSQGSKRIARLLTDINEVYPTVSNKISTLQTAGLSTAQHGHAILVPYIMCQMETIFTIQRDCVWSLLLRKPHSKETIKWVHNPTTMQFLLMYSSILGGPPILPLSAFMYRGHPDPLTATLTDIYLLANELDLAKKFYSYWQDLLCKPGKSEGGFLILSPFALNLDLPSPSISIFKNFLSKHLPGITMNYHLSDIFSQNMKEEEERLMNKLLEIHPVYPTICHELLSCTVVGAMNAFLARFATTRTTQIAGISDSNDNRIYSKIQKSEIEYFEYWQKIHKDVVTLEIAECEIVLCPFKVAKNIRQYTWSSALKGRRINGVTVPHPFHQFKFNLYDSAIEGKSTAKEKVSYILNTIDSKTLLMDRGPYKPYLGSKTREKKTGRVIVLPVSSRPLDSAERICLLSTWCTMPRSNISHFLKTLTESRTNVPYEILKLAAGSISSGALQHRLNDHISKRNAQNNSLPNITTHIYMSTDTLGKFSRGEDNYNMHVQGVILAGFALIQILSTNLSKLPSEYMSMSFSCQQDLEPLDAAIVDIEDPHIAVLKKENNPLIFTKIDEAPSLSQAVLTNILLVDDRSDNFAGATILLGRIISALNLSAWGVTDYHILSSSVLGVQEILRIGLQRLLRALAIYIILLFPYDQKGVEKLVSMLPLNIWVDIAPICLLPEILPSLVEASNLYLSDAFVNPYQVSRMLTRALIIEMGVAYHQIAKNSTYLKKVTFYLSENIGIRRIWFMWCKQISLISSGKYHIHDLIPKKGAKHSLLTNLPSPPEIGELTTAIVKKYGVTGLKEIWQDNRIRISRYPPEERMRLRERPISLAIKVKKMKGAPMTLQCKIVNAGYPVQIKIPAQSPNWELFDPMYESKIVNFQDYTWADHSFHLFGHTSSSYLKILEILIRESISGIKSALGVGDGEGGISRLLYNYYQCEIFFNSMVDRELLVPHRAYGYTPASFFDIPHIPQGAALSAVYGGNLLNTAYLTELAKFIGKKIDLIFCDAELLSASSKDWIQLLANVLHLCSELESDYLIFKSYYRDSRLVCDMIGMCNVVYQDISVIITTFSSNETLEFHLVCKNRVSFRSPYNTLSNVQGRYYRIQSSISVYSAIDPLFRERIRDEPFQCKRIEFVREMYNISSQLSIPSNLQAAIERYTLNIKIYHHGTSVRQYLSQVNDEAHQLCLDELRGFGLSQEGTTVSPYLKAVMSRTKSIHTALERYLIISINCCLILSVMHEDNLSLLYKGAKDYICSEHNLYDQHGNQLYSLQLDWHEWRSEFLKLYWVIIGHHLELYNLQE